MKITEQFIVKNKTKNRAWTKRQLEIIGVPWPPKPNWKKRVIGNTITEAQALEFENIAMKTFD